MLNASQISDRLETIATSLNEAGRSAGDYNHWDEFCALCGENDLDVDHERQDEEDEEAAYELFTEQGSLHFSDSWLVDYRSIVEA